MSRIGRMPIEVVSGVEIKLEADRIRVKGPKGTLEQPLAPFTKVEVRDNQVIVLRDGDSKPAKAAHGLMRAQIANMMKGVTQGFSRALDLVGVGYRAEASGKQVKLALGFSHPVVVKVPDGLDVKADSPTRLVVSGMNKQQVGQFAADLREIRPPEPYKGKGIRYSDERVRRKVGKAAVGAGGT